MKKEMSMEVRLLLAFGLMGLVLLISQFFLKPVPPADPKKETPAEVGAEKNAAGKAAAAAAATQTPTAPPAARAATAQKPPATDIRGTAEEQTIIETDLFRVNFSNRGAVVRSWILKGYSDQKKKPLELVYQSALSKVSAPFAMSFHDPQPATDPNAVLYKTERSPDGLGVTFTYVAGGSEYRKSFQFANGNYLVKATSQASQNGVPLAHSITWRGGFGDTTIVKPAGAQHTSYYDTAAQKLTSKSAGDAKKGPVSASGQFSFAGIEDSYFAAVFLPEGKNNLEQTTFSDTVPDSEGKDEPRVGIGVGGASSNGFSLYVGPKDTELLRKVDPKLDQVVDWGWFGVIAKPLFAILSWTNKTITHSYGWAIILVTLAINIVLFPFRLTGIKSSKKMQALQPQVKAINEKYKNLSMRDPKKSDQQQELMELYRKNDVNVASGCVPLLIQLPFLWAFYKVLSVSIEMRGADWLWVTDLSQPETLAIKVLPVLLVITQFAMQKMTPSPGMDPTQQKMMLIMPAVFGYMFYFQSAGLVLYWLTGNIVGIIQQWVLNRFMPVPVVEAPKVAPGKKK